MPHHASSRAARRAAAAVAAALVAVLLGLLLPASAQSSPDGPVEPDTVLVHIDAITPTLPSSGTVDVAGTVTNPANCGGYVDWPTFDATVGTLVARHPDFGGVFGWEYFNSVGYDGGGRESWFAHVADVVGR